MVCKATEESRLWLLGVFLSIIASCCTNLGVNLQKFSFLKEAKRQVVAKRRYFRQPTWVIGIALVVFGSLGDFAALGFAPQTLITPVGGFTMVANVFFAHSFLGEAFSLKDGFATTLVIAGVILVAAFASKGSNCYTLTELTELYRRPPFIVYCVIVILCCVLLYRLVKKIERIHTDFGSGSTRYAKFERWHPVLYPALSGVFGAQSVLFAKSTAELFKSTFTGDSQFDQFGTYLILLGMLTCVFLQIHWLAQGLQRFDAVFVVPVFQCFFISISIIGGGVYFDEFQTMETLQIVMFTLGVVITLAGVALLSQRKMNQLRPLQKFRSSVEAVIFIKRLQKILGHDYHWVDNESLVDFTSTTRRSIGETISSKSTALQRHYYQQHSSASHTGHTSFGEILSSTAPSLVIIPPHFDTRVSMDEFELADFTSISSSDSLTSIHVPSSQV